MGNWTLDGAMEHWALWWCNGQIRDPSNGKIGPLMAWWGNWEALDLLITWWDIIGHHFDDMRKWGPFDDAMGKLETLNKAMGKLWGGGWGNYLMGKWEMGPWWRNGTFAALWWCNGQIRDPSNGKMGLLDDLMGKLEALDLLITWWEIRGHHCDDMMTFFCITLPWMNKRKE